jgi:hypothetical protein
LQRGDEHGNVLVAEHQRRPDRRFPEIERDKSFR